MNYVCGIDGGGTKSLCVIANDNGDILAVSFGGCTNHQICGIDEACNVISSLVNQALVYANLTIHDLSFIVMGLAGADLKTDIELLNSHIAKTMPDLYSKAPIIINDVWIAFNASVLDGWGAVSICGTGHNAGVLKPNGQTIGVRALRQVLGNYGGGKHITDTAFHYAFRSNENTGDYTLLEQKLPAFCNARDMDHLAKLVYESDYTYQYKFAVSKLVFELSQAGDSVCINMLDNMGKTLGRMTAGLIEKAELENTQIPVVLAGSIYLGSDIIVDGFKKSLSKRVPNFNLYVLSEQPVIGAIFLALNKIGVNITDTIKQKVINGIKQSEKEVLYE